jgi:DNA-binding NarL/FixJ family response regulator
LSQKPPERIGAVARQPNVRDFRLTSGNKEIARRLGGTAKQVSQQKARLLARLQINSPDEIADA